MLNESTSTGAKKLGIGRIGVELAVVHGKVILSSGKECGLLRVAGHVGAPGFPANWEHRELTAGLDYAAVGD